MKEVPIWEKSNLTLEEAAKRLIKRRKLDEYTEKMFSL